MFSNQEKIRTFMVRFKFRFKGCMICCSSVLRFSKTVVQCLLYLSIEMAAKPLVFGFEISAILEQ